MALRIRLARSGAKRRPYYRIVVAENTSRRDGSFIEKVGTYNPMLPKDDPNRVVLKEDRAKYWLATGAQPSERVAILLGQAKLMDLPKAANRPQQSQPKAKAQQRLKDKEEKLKAAEEAKRQAEEDAKAAAAPAPAAEEAPAVEEAPAAEAPAEAAPEAPAAEAAAAEAPAEEA